MHRTVRPWKAPDAGWTGPPVPADRLADHLFEELNWGPAHLVCFCFTGGSAVMQLLLQGGHAFMYISRFTLALSQLLPGLLQLVV